MKFLVAIAVMLVLLTSAATACTRSGAGSIKRLIRSEIVVAGRFADCTIQQMRPLETQGKPLEFVIEVTDQIRGNAAALVQGSDLIVLLPAGGYEASLACQHATWKGRKFLFGLAVLNVNTGSMWKFHREPQDLANGVFPSPPILDTGDRLAVSQSDLCGSGTLFAASDDMIDHAKRVFDGVGDLEPELEQLVSSHARFGLY